jgi:hypothetical protein
MLVYIAFNRNKYYFIVFSFICVCGYWIVILIYRSALVIVQNI